MFYHIDINNIKGQKVRSLVNGFYPAGEYSVIWNGHDDHGAEVSSGIYLYRMEAGEYKTVRRMLLVK